MIAREVSIVDDDFSTERAVAWLAAADSDGVGALVTFTGHMRGRDGADRVCALELEHYPDMTERSIDAIVDQAVARWPLLAVRVIHRVGRIIPGERIVFVGVASSHRGDAFAACEYIMDYLKTRAPLWKKEYLAGGGERWVDARTSDCAAAARWRDEATR